MISQRFHVYYNEVYTGIGYDIIIVLELMVQIGRTANFKRKVLQWCGAVVPMKETSIFLGQTDSIRCNMREVTIQTT